jgi:hypothetical protein
LTPNSVIEEEAEPNINEGDVKSSPSLVGSAYFDSTSNGRKRRRGRPAKPLSTLPLASVAKMNFQQRNTYNRQRNNEASRICRRKKRVTELELECECDNLERRNQKLESKLKKLQALKEVYTNLFAKLCNR